MLTLFVPPVHAEWNHHDFDLALKASIFVKHLGCSKLTEKHNLCRFLLSSFFKISVSLLTGLHFRLHLRHVAAFS